MSQEDELRLIKTALIEIEGLDCKLAVTVLEAMQEGEDASRVPMVLAAVHLRAAMRSVRVILDREEATEWLLRRVIDMPDNVGEPPAADGAEDDHAADEGSLHLSDLIVHDLVKQDDLATFVLVEWLDSSETRGWFWLDEDDQSEPLARVRSLGWLLRLDEEEIVILPHLSRPDSRGRVQASSAMKIPAKAVVSFTSIAVPPEAA